MTVRSDDYCSVRGQLGKTAADELFGRTIPPGIDFDHPGDQALLEAILHDRDRCAACPDRRRCGQATAVD